MPAQRATVLVLAIVAVATAGCGHLGANLRQREIVVHFAPGATPQQHEQVRAACANVPAATAEPIPTSKLRSVQLNDVRFRIDNADDAQIAKLESCLTAFPFVQGVSDTADVMH